MVSSEGQHVPDENASGGKDSPGERVVETVECPNCGRRFVGDYCPGCGQEADPSPSVTGVIGGFFRELVDLEGGFWPTFVGLTFRPGQVLRDYLSGVRAGLISPGRYLLAAVVISFGVRQGLIQLGLLQGVKASLTAAIPGDASGENRQTMEAFFEVVGQVTQSQWGALATTLGFAGLLSLFFWRIFEGKVHCWSEALAVSAFTVGHWTALGAGLLVMVVLLEYLATGTPANTSTYIVPSYLLAFAYSGAAAYGLGSGWKSAVQGALSGVWALVEAGAIFGLLTAGYFLLQVRPLGGLPREERIIFGAIAVAYLAPLLLHAAVELYYRLR